MRPCASRIQRRTGRRAYGINLWEKLKSVDDWPNHNSHVIDCGQDHCNHTHISRLRERPQVRNAGSHRHYCYRCTTLQMGGLCRQHDKNCLRAMLRDGRNHQVPLPHPMDCYVSHLFRRNPSLPRTIKVRHVQVQTIFPERNPAWTRVRESIPGELVPTTEISHD